MPPIIASTVPPIPPSTQPPTNPTAPRTNTQHTGQRANNDQQPAHNQQYAFHRHLQLINHSGKI